ncbi:hypothetical protein NL676_034243 [Syzygium grande]|nr:hypothetical protein NL676_034243 [Syzygium grande]
MGFEFILNAPCRSTTTYGSPFAWCSSCQPPPLGYRRPPRGVSAMLAAMMLGGLALGLLAPTMLAFVKSTASKIFRKPTTTAKREEANDPEAAATSGGDAPSPAGEEYEVFLSFRGPDTRAGFTDCLYHDMLGAGIRVYRDDEELRVGREIGGELMRALDVSKIYLPIFSRDYASSSWCLREVAHMVDCAGRSKGNKEILPVFFDASPADVKLRTGLYRNAMAKHRKKFGAEEVKRVWVCEEAIDIVRTKQRKKKVQALILSGSQFQPLVITHDELSRLPNLRFLELEDGTFVGDFGDNFSKLRWISWHSPRPLDLEVTNLSIKNLVVFEIFSGSITDDWSGWSLIKMAKNLKVLNLRALRIVPDLSNLTNLVDLLLSDGSEDVVQASSELLPSSSLGWIRRLSKLKKLELSLSNIPAPPTEFGSLPRLNELILCGLDLQFITQLPPSLSELQLVHFNSTVSWSIFSNLKNLSKLRLSQSQLQEIELSGLEQLRALTVSKCELLERLFIPASLKKLKELWVLECPRLVEIEGLETLESLEEMYVQYCDSIERLYGLSNSKLLNCLFISDCHELRAVEGLSGLESLNAFLVLECSSLEILIIPSSLYKLKQLEVSGCQKLIEIAGLGALESLETLTIKECQSIIKLCELSNLQMLKSLSIDGCHELQAIDGVDELDSLREFNVFNCRKLEALMDELQRHDCYSRKLSFGVAPSESSDEEEDETNDEGEELEVDRDSSDDKSSPMIVTSQEPDTEL